MQEDPKEQRLRDWVEGRLKAGCTEDEIKESLFGFGYSSQAAADAIKKARDVISYEADDFVQMKELIQTFDVDIRSYDLKDHFDKLEKVFLNPMNFIDGIKESEDKVTSKIIIYVVLNLCIYSLITSLGKFIFGEPFLSLVALFFYDILFYTVVFLVSGYILNRLLRLLGGRGALFDTLQVSAYSLSVVVLAFLPYLWVIPVIYGYAMMVYNLSIVHRLPKKPVLIAVGVPTVFVLVVFALLSAVAEIG
ncbi:MAG: Yip1 family protein [archaeon]